MSFGAHTETIGILTDLWIADYLGSISAALSFCWAVSYKSPFSVKRYPSFLTLAEAFLLILLQVVLRSSRDL
jgi:hypothetical protein